MGADQQPLRQDGNGRAPGTACSKEKRRVLGYPMRTARLPTGACPAQLSQPTSPPKARAETHKLCSVLGLVKAPVKRHSPGRLAPHISRLHFKTGSVKAKCLPVQNENVRQSRHHSFYLYRFRQKPVRELRALTTLEVCGMPVPDTRVHLWDVAVLGSPPARQTVVFQH